MQKFSANLGFLFSELPFLDRFEAAAKAGFKAVEYAAPYSHPVSEITARLQANGLSQVLFNTPFGDTAKGERGVAALPGRQPEFAVHIRSALDYAQALNCPLIHVMAGTADGQDARRTFVANVALAAQLAADVGVGLTLEPLNDKDNPGYFLTQCSDAREIIDEVASQTGISNVWLQYDFYHRQIMAGDIEHGLAAYGDIIKHMQVANLPDRGEPDRGELNFGYLLGQVEASAYDGWVGCEYVPRGDTIEGLSWFERCGLRLV